MIAPGARVDLASGVTDMRKGIDGLMELGAVVATAEARIRFGIGARLI
ncbi:hypothetical protein [Rhizobium indigoferae]|uniref:Uncharacterized protein n=1 Tax=Rhizobium indigoferae TaxID=158891 RepID=A0ABZ1DRR9_9HYPH|nr:hypothetical protein [Rhizobium indigoferae]WRW37650.1 hypothetical protein U5G49_007253 [Rhizobium indigoferae]GLR58203.1 hypothetical protein GCM10007919_29280 [Rhizobium indigoferae]